MSNQLNPCKECWSDPIITHAEWIFDRKDESISYNKVDPESNYTVLHCPECDPDISDHNKFSPSSPFEGDQYYDMVQWNKANPISHAAKMLLETNTRKYHKPPVYDEICKHCKQYVTGQYRKGRIYNILRIKHLPDCALITEARLPLKEKADEAT